MTDEEIRTVAKTAAKEAVYEMMVAMGVDASKPEAMIEMQKDFQSLRNWRKSVDAIQRQGIVTAVGVIVVGFLGMIYMHFRQ